MPQFTDASGRTIGIEAAPKRIISLVPSQTELLHYLGLDTEVVGITKFCVHPKQWHHSKKRVGGTKKLHIDIIRRLQPDLVIANKEENNKDDMEEIGSFCPVFTTNVTNLEEAMQMIRIVGSMVKKETEAGLLADHIASRFQQLRAARQNFRVAYLIWKGPYMTVGCDTFIHDMLRKCGLVNVFGDGKRYPETELEALDKKGCEAVLLSSEPYPFKEKDREEIAAATGLPVFLVDGEMFSWYGSRLLQAAGYFSQLIMTLEENIKLKR